MNQHYTIVSLRSAPRDHRFAGMSCQLSIIDNAGAL